jgi:uncharacterized protein
MAKFLIAAADPRKNSVMPLIYDNMESTLTDIQGNSVIRTVEAVVQVTVTSHPQSRETLRLGKHPPAS